MSFLPPHQDAACALISAAGLDPNVIRIKGITPDGYDEFVFDPDTGKRIFAPATYGFEVIRRYWPTPELGQRVYELMKGFA